VVRGGEPPVVAVGGPVTGTERLAAGATPRGDSTLDALRSSPTMSPQHERAVAEEASESLRADPHLGPLVDEHGTLTLDPAEDLFTRLVVSVLRQQVSMAAADAIEERLFETVEVSPAGILRAEEEVLRDAGLSRQKTRYVTAIARSFVENGHSRERFLDASNEEIVDALTDITGVGQWTAEMQLMFCFGRPDVFPVGDLGIRRGMERVFGEEMSRTEMVDRAERWRPYRSYGSLYLWRAVD